MMPPIFIDYNGDLNVFRSVESAQSYIEPEDAGDSRTQLYDAEGHLSMAIPVHSRGRQMQIVQAEQEPRHADELRDKLLRFLEYVKYPCEQLQAQSLSRLVKFSLLHASG